MSLAGQLLRRHKVVTESLSNLKKRFQRSNSIPLIDNEAENVAIKIRANPKADTHVYVKNNKSKK